MKLRYGVILLIAIVCSATAQPDLEVSLEGMVDSCASLLPAEESITEIIAILIDYCWAFCGYALSWIPMVLKARGYSFIGLSHTLNLTGEWLKLIGSSCSSLLLTGWVWELFVLCGSVISSDICGDFGRMLIEIGNSCGYLDYFFEVEQQGQREDI